MKRLVDVIYLLSLFFIAISGIASASSKSPYSAIFIFVAMFLSAWASIWLFHNKAFTIKHANALKYSLGVFMLGFCIRLFLTDNTITAVEMCLLAGCGSLGIILLIKWKRDEKNIKKEELALKIQSIGIERARLNDVKPAILKWSAIILYFVVLCGGGFAALKGYGFKNFFSGSGGAKQKQSKLID